MAYSIEALEDRRLFAAGTLDTTYGTAGVATLTAYAPAAPPGTIAFPTQMANDAAGRTLVLVGAGNAYNVTRLTADGTPDGRFAAKTGGKISFTAAVNPNDPHDTGPQIAVDGNNRLYVLNGTTISRYISSGTLDTHFGRRGIDRLTDFRSINDIAVDHSNRLWLTGMTDTGTGVGTGMTVARLDGAGVYDTAFGRDGKFGAPRVVIGLAKSVGRFLRVLADGSVLALGSLDDTSSGVSRQRGVLSLKFTADGALDRAYGKNGYRVYTQVTAATPDRFVSAVGIRTDGTVVTYVTDDHDATFKPANPTLTPAGRDFPDAGLAEVVRAASFYPQVDGGEVVLDQGADRARRYSPNGRLDHTFHDGHTITAHSLTLATDGSLLVGNNAGDLSVGIARYYGSEAPAGRLVPSTLIASTPTLPFRVIWRDDDGVDADTITGTELRIITPDGNYYRPSLLGKSRTSNGQVIADYGLRSPVGKRYTADVNGIYRVRLVGDKVKDTGGVATGSITLGSLVVRIA